MPAVRESLRCRRSRLRAVATMALGLALPSACAHLGLVEGTSDVSYGAPHAGYIARPRRLASRGTGYEVLRTRAEGGQHYGTARLVAAIERTAADVRRSSPRGAPLRVGDLSGPTGGQIPHHRSHRAGRDADLLFYALDEQGRPVPAPTFVRYDAQGRSLDPEHLLRFDVHRNWLLVASLARDRDAGVVWIFCADRLRTLMLEHARALNVDDDTMARAADLLHQPGDSAPHDDHFHVRVACTPDERARGCRDGGPIAWWNEHRFGKSDAAPLDDAALLAVLAEDPAPSAAPPITARRDTSATMLRGARAPHALHAPLAAVSAIHSPDAP